MAAVVTGDGSDINLQTFLDDPDCALSRTLSESLASLSDQGQLDHIAVDHFGQGFTAGSATANSHTTVALPTSSFDSSDWSVGVRQFLKENSSTALEVGSRISMEGKVVPLYDDDLVPLHASAAFGEMPRFKLAFQCRNNKVGNFNDHPTKGVGLTVKGVSPLKGERAVLGFIEGPNEEIQPDCVVALCQPWIQASETAQFMCTNNKSVLSFEFGLFSADWRSLNLADRVLRAAFVLIGRVQDGAAVLAVHRHYFWATNDGNLPPGTRARLCPFRRLH